MAIENSVLKPVVPGTRDLAFDLVRTAGILLVVAGHASPPWPLEKAIYSFHMPLFFILSGFLFKPCPVRPLLGSKTRMLLVPYVAAALVTAIAYHVAAGMERTVGDTISAVFAGILSAKAPDALYWNTPLWFLPALFWGLVAFGCLHTIVGNRLAAPLAMILGAMLIIPVGHVRPFVPFGLDTATAALFFIGVGWGLREVRLLEMADLPQQMVLGGAAFSLWVALRFCDRNAYYVVAHLKLSPLWLSLPTGIAGSIALIMGIKVAYHAVTSQMRIGTTANRMIVGAALLSFPVYLIHKPIVLGLIQLSRNHGLAPPAVFAVAFVVGLFVSYAIVLLFVRTAPRMAAVVLGGRVPVK